MPRRRTHADRGLVVPSVVVVASAVAIVVAAVAFIVGAGGPHRGAGNEPVAGPAPHSTGAPSESSTHASGPGDAHVADQHARHNGPKRDAHHGHHARHQSGRERKKSTNAVPDVYVEVYNNSSISGLAATTAARLQDSGWQVVGTDNWYGDIPQSTVYYPSRLAGPARKLAATLGVSRIHPAVAPMRFDRLTVILTSEVPG